MKNNDKGMGELLELLKTHPELISALVFDPTNIKRLLKSKAARRLVLGVNVKTFLQYVAGSEDGAEIALCLRRTVDFCAATIVCTGGTKRPTKPCTGGTKRCDRTKPPCSGGTKPKPCARTKVCTGGTKPKRVG